MAKTKFYSLYGKAIDANGIEHYITVVGRMTPETVIVPLTKDRKGKGKRGKTYNVIEVHEIPKKKRVFSMAWSICDPRDTFDEAVGIELAKNRLDTYPIGTLESYDITMLNADQCQMYVFAELNYMIKNIDKYID